MFICENNQYAYSVPIEKSMAIDDVADRAASYGFDGVAINGNDVLAVYQATLGAHRARAAAGDGPTLIECKTYRWHGHSEHDKAFYRRTKSSRCGRAAIRSRRSRRTQGRCTSSTDDKLKDVEARVTSTIDDAVEFAANAPDPAPEDAVTTCMHSRGTTRKSFIGGS